MVKSLGSFQYGKRGLDRRIKSSCIYISLVIITLSKSKLPDLSSRLYSKLAEEFDTNVRHIERAIARAVTHINNACGKEYILRTILGYDVDASNYTLCVKELIALISDQLRIQYFNE